MPYNFAFYIHHHGAGHLMRSLAIAERLNDCKLTFIGSDLWRHRNLIPSWIECIELPMDIPDQDDHSYSMTKPAGLHYAPLNVRGQRERVRMLTEFFTRDTSMLLVVDVSVEVAMLATLSGVPYIAVRQHGLRTDQPHLIAYENAYGLLAPYAKELHPNEEDWLFHKTFFSGGFSRFDKETRNVAAGRVAAILVGRGGTSIDSKFVAHLAARCPNWHFHIIGSLAGSFGFLEAPNVVMHGSIPSPEALLKTCTVVLGNAGHNTVMEIASMGKHLIVIPEDRPFDEQRIKSALLAKMGFATVVEPSLLYSFNWSTLFEDLLLKEPNWGSTIAEHALSEISCYLKAKFSELFY